MHVRDLSSDTLVYEAIQRIFRNAVISHVRECLSLSYPDTWLDEVHKCFKEEEWTSARLSADSATNLGYVDRKAQDDLDILGVNNFYGLFEKHFPQLIPEEEMPPAEFVPKLRQSVLGWLREIKGVRDPVSHPPSEDMSLADALRSVDSTSRVSRKLHLESTASELGEVFGELLSRASTSPETGASGIHLEDSLPPRESVVVDFVGRESELTDLWRWLTDDASTRWLLSGDGGKGKSAVAYKFAADVALAAPADLAAVFWLSAKRRRFLEGEVVDVRSPDFWDLDSALNKLLSDYGFGDEARKSTEAKRLMVLDLLEELPCLLVVDDLDSIPPENEDVVAFMTHDAPNHKTKVLVTSRRQFAGMGRSCTAISGLDEEAAAVFLRSRAALMEIPEELLTDHRCVEIAHICDGSPLYMEDLLRLCKFLPIQDALEAWKSKKGDTVRRYALEREIEMLSLGAREVLRACSIAQVPLTTEEIGRVIGATQEATIDAIDELRRMYLVPAAQLIEDVPRFAVNRNVSTLVRASMEDDPNALALANAVTAVLGKRLSSGQARGAQDYIRQARALTGAGRHREAVETLRAGLVVFPNNPDVLGWLGMAYAGSRPPRVADARDEWMRAYELGNKHAAVYLRWVDMELSEEQWQKAAEAAERGLERVGATEQALVQKAGYARSRLGRSLQGSFNDERARTELSAADTLLTKAVRLALDRGATDFYTSRAFRAWVLNAQLRGDGDALCDRLLRWLDWNRNDPYALAEGQRQGGRCPGVQAFLRQAQGT